MDAANRAQVSWRWVVIVLSTGAAVLIIVAITLWPRGPTLHDFGDAPDPTYPSLLASNSARHAEITWAWFGDNVDAEADARVPNADSFDDGLVSYSPITFEVTDNNWADNLYVNILADLNNDGNWDEPNEWVVQNRVVNVPPGQSQVFTTDNSLPPHTWIRMTLTGESLSNYVGRGAFQIGETEDHLTMMENAVYK